MRSLTFLAFFISLIVLLMTLSIYFYYFTPISEFSYFSSAYVTKDTTGFDLNSSALTFGSFAVGGSSTRSVIINNSYPFPIRVEPRIDGSIKQIISYDPLVVYPYKTGKFYFTVSTDSIDLLGNYSGNISIALMRA